MKDQFTRIFHPIGQGAFYTEQHSFVNESSNKEETLTIVYDCGSKLKKEARDAKIKGALPKGTVIDILFISHFHSDHINGIKILNENYEIKNVVIPLLDEKNKVILFIDNYLIFGEKEAIFSDILINNPKSFFNKDTNIIRVDSRNIESSEGFNSDDNILREPSIYYEHLNRYQRIFSGTKINIYKQGIQWILIPFNYQQEERLVEFKQELEKEGISDVSALTKEVILSELKMGSISFLYKAYSQISGDLNTNSLVLFSGTEQEIQGLVRVNSAIARISEFGCLFMGDVNLKSIGLIADLKSKLQNLVECIGIIQIPHHGSIDNYSEDIFTISNNGLFVVSYGATNSYGHPSPYVIAEFSKRRYFIMEVTENPYTAVYQQF